MTRTVFITGATSGFGRACARRFACKGWNLVISGRRSERLFELQEELSDQAAAILPLTLDVCDTQAVLTTIKTLPAPFEQVYTLINNAGLALGTEPAQAADLEKWHRMIDTNIKGLSTITHTLLPNLIAQGRGASIINIGSVAGHWPYPGGNVYCGTKAFVEQFSYALRADLKGTGVRVSNIAPGMAESEFTLVRTDGNQAAHDALYAGAEPIQPEDIADTCWWLANLPAHLNVNALELMPVRQSFSAFTVHRENSNA
ncbi:MAG: SDR family NAD(P)-dependent oxidoreductase [Parahaliea sp.]